MGVVHGELFLCPAMRSGIGHGDLLLDYFPLRVPVLVVVVSILAVHGFQILIDGVDAARGMHPAQSRG